MEVTVNGARVGLTGRLRDYPARVDTLVLRRLRTRVGPRLAAHMQDLVSGRLLNVRTGQGRRSISWRIERSALGNALLVGADLSLAPYMRIQDMGGLIVPKRSAHLTIPVGEAVTARGVARFTARELISSPGSFGFQGTFVHREIIFGRRKAEITPLFVLKKSVRITPVRFRRRTLTSQRAWVRSEVRTAVRSGLKRSGT